MWKVARVELYGGSGQGAVSGNQIKINQTDFFEFHDPGGGGRGGWVLAATPPLGSPGSGRMDTPLETGFSSIFGVKMPVFGP